MWPVGLNKKSIIIITIIDNFVNKPAAKLGDLDLYWLNLDSKLQDINKQPVINSGVNSHTGAAFTLTTSRAM